MQFIWKLDYLDQLFGKKVADTNFKIRLYSKFQKTFLESFFQWLKYIITNWNVFRVFNDLENFEFFNFITKP